MYLRVIGHQSEKDHTLSQVQPDIERAIELTGEVNLFRRGSLRFYENEGQYNIAATIARMIGLEEKAKAYEKIGQLIHPHQ